MLRYILWRIAAMVPTLVLISILVFTIIELPPGDYFESYAAEMRAQGENADMDKLNQLRAEYGFDKPAYIRYFYWVGGMLHGDFGYSFEYELPVSDVVGDRLWLTVLVSFVTIVFTWLIAFPIGMYSATHQYSWGDYGLTFLGLIGIAIGLGLAGGASLALSIPFSPSVLVILLAVGFSALIGMVFGFFPALRGARLDPIEALRHE